VMFLLLLLPKNKKRDKDILNSIKIVN